MHGNNKNFALLFTILVDDYSKQYLSWATLSSSGSSQPLWHSQWESMNTSTSPAALAAPSARHPPTPRRLVLRIKRTPSR